LPIASGLSGSASRVYASRRARAIGDSPDRREHPAKDEFGTPADSVVERAAGSGEKPGAAAIANHDQSPSRGRAPGPRRDPLYGARQPEVAHSPAAWIDTAGQKALQVGGEAAPEAGRRKNTAKSLQHRPFAGVAIRYRLDHELASANTARKTGMAGSEPPRSIRSMTPPSAARGQENIGAIGSCCRKRREDRDLREGRRELWRGGAVAIVRLVTWKAPGHLDMISTY